MKTLIGLLLLVGVASANTVPPTANLPNPTQLLVENDHCPIYVDIYNDSFPLPASFGVIWWDLGGKIHGGSVPVFTYTGAANTAAMQALLQCAASCVSSCP